MESPSAVTGKIKEKQHDIKWVSIRNVIDSWSLMAIIPSVDMKALLIHQERMEQDLRQQNHARNLFDLPGPQIFARRDIPNLKEQRGKES